MLYLLNNYHELSGLDTVNIQCHIGLRLIGCLKKITKSLGSSCKIKKIMSFELTTNVLRLWFECSKMTAGSLPNETMKPATIWLYAIH